MRKTLRLTVTLPDHTPTAAMATIARTIERAIAAANGSARGERGMPYLPLRSVLAQCLDATTANTLPIAVESLILPDAPAPSDLAAHARASVSDAEWAAYLAATWAAGTSDRD
jgi:hypothetical protein